MKRYCLLILLSFAFFTALAPCRAAAGNPSPRYGLASQDQEMLALVREMLATCRISASYRYETGAQVTVSGSGTLLLDGDCYLLRGNGLDVYCDGTTRWTVDAAAKEVYVEAAAEVKEYLLHPENLSDRVRDLRYDDGQVSGVYTDPEKGTVIQFVFSSITSGPQQHDKSEFVFQTEGLDASWVVTDLR